ncbi:MAG: trehalase calcium-binding domain-containing protein, partial [Bacteroidota bacterium]
MQVNISETLDRLLLQEDTDGDTKITVEDRGPKLFVLKGANGETYEVYGTYHLSNLLQELVIARNE